MSQTVPIFRGDGTVRCYALVDDGDYDLVAAWTWRLHSEGYACANGATVYMHRVVCGLAAGDGLEADHINGKESRLDNRRSNLRIGTHAENQQNRSLNGNAKYGKAQTSSSHRGVIFCKYTGRWIARVHVGGKTHHIDRFDTEAEAARAAATFRSLHMPFSQEATHGTN